MHDFLVRVLAVRLDIAFPADTVRADMQVFAAMAHVVPHHSQGFAQCFGEDLTHFIEVYPKKILFEVYQVLTTSRSTGQSDLFSDELDVVKAALGSSLDFAIRNEGFHHFKNRMRRSDPFVHLCHQGTHVADGLAKSVSRHAKHSLFYK